MDGCRIDLVIMKAACHLPAQWTALLDFKELGPGVVVSDRNVRDNRSSLDWFSSFNTCFRALCSR